MSSAILLSAHPFFPIPFLAFPFLASFCEQFLVLIALEYLGQSHTLEIFQKLLFSVVQLVEEFHTLSLRWLTSANSHASRGNRWCEQLLQGRVRICVCVLQALQLVVGKFSFKDIEEVFDGSLEPLPRAFFAELFLDRTPPQCLVLAKALSES